MPQPVCSSERFQLLKFQVTQATTCSIVVIVGNIWLRENILLRTSVPLETCGNILTSPDKSNSIFNHAGASFFWVNLNEAQTQDTIFPREKRDMSFAHNGGPSTEVFSCAETSRHSSNDVFSYDESFADGLHSTTHMNIEYTQPHSLP